MPLFRRHRAELKAEDIDEHDILPVTGRKGWVDYMYIVFFFFFAGMACSGCLFYFTLEDKDDVTLSFGIRDHCGGYEESWKLSDGKMKIKGFEDIDWDEHDWTYWYDYDATFDGSSDSDDPQSVEDRIIQSVFFLECFQEVHRGHIRSNFNSTVEIYLLSLLLFVCLLIEMKEYISTKGLLSYNILTVLYYIVECGTFFIYAAQIFNSIGRDVEYDYSMSMLNAMNGPTNAFITAVVVERAIIGMACLVLIYFSKEKNSTEYVAPEKVVKTLNESLSFFFIIGLSSVLAVVVLGVYVEDNSEPGEYVVAEDCGIEVMETWREECGDLKASMREKVCDVEWLGDPDNIKWFLTEYQSEVDSRVMGDKALPPPVEDPNWVDEDACTTLEECLDGEEIEEHFGKCKACGVLPDETSYNFFSDEQRLCITDKLGNLMEDNVDSFILAYSASYMFFLVLLHGERDRFQSTLGWYLFRAGFALMLFAEGIAFMVFRGEWIEQKQFEIMFNNPRPMAEGVTGLIIAAACIRFTILAGLFVLEQYEVGCSYCRCFLRFRRKELDLETKDIELSTNQDGEGEQGTDDGEQTAEDVEQASKEVSGKGRVKLTFFRS